MDAAAAEFESFKRSADGVEASGQSWLNMSLVQKVADGPPRRNLLGKVSAADDE